MKNLGTAGVRECRVKNKLAYMFVVKFFSGFVFRRKSEDGKYYVRLDKE